MFKPERIQKAWTIAAATLLLSTVAPAAPITYDFTGVGSVCGTTCFSGDFFGTMTIEVIAPGPAGPDAYVDEGAGYVSDSSGWVNSSYQINWAEGSFTPGAFAGSINTSQGATVVNGPTEDWMQSRTWFESYVEGSHLYYDQTQFTRYSADTSWLSDREFRTDLGLASGPGSYNSLFFASYFVDWFGGTPEQVTGRVSVNTLVARSATPVPEPSTLILLAVGMLGAISVARRRGLLQ